MQASIRQKKKKLFIEHFKRKRYNGVELRATIGSAIKKNTNQGIAKLAMLSSKQASLHDCKLLSKLQNRCLETGRMKSYQKLFGLSRLRLKDACVKGRLQNIKTRSW